MIYIFINCQINPGCD